MVYMVTFTINIPPMLAYIYIYHTWILWVCLVDTIKITRKPPVSSVTWLAGKASRNTRMVFPARNLHLYYSFIMNLKLILLYYLIFSRDFPMVL